MRIGFLLNHDQIHQAAHVVPVAAALARLRPELDLVLATGSDAMDAEARRLLALLGSSVPVTRLRLHRPFGRVAARMLDPLLPAGKLLLYRDNLPFFRSLDALVVPEKTSAILRTRYGLRNLRLIHTRHGAGDRAIGFNRTSAAFDRVLVAGPKIRDRLVRDAGVAPDRIAVVGYPKFDLPAGADVRALFADPDKPLVLYNPHPSPRLSSWYRDGRAVLDHFRRDRSRNLVFAPHAMLFRRSFALSVDPPALARPGRVARRFRDAPNILVDPGSVRSTDMSYTAAADLYLGDVSSQIYEFLRTPRPCVFIDSHRTAWRDDPSYRHWQAGEVIEGAAGLGAALDRAFAAPDRYRAAQEALFAATFDITAEPSADRAARAVLAVLEE
ncbi:hypothetical protein [Rhizosaccharibacter radicis]|uniref:Glycosyl transferase n=1 Tax=Rhizosaccharibacter radicis TaxID=2782605 RepID=A0ABT1VZT0_9PROT|nr:hypothetical protein [Acetobacteraceae bacterium KSS12]